MTELERRALLGDKEAQKECTEKEIILPCNCGGNAVLRADYYDGTVDVCCTDCGIQTLAYSNYKKAIGKWNTRTPPPIGRCGECKNAKRRYETGVIICDYLNCLVKSDFYCKQFQPKEREENGSTAD